MVDDDPEFRRAIELLLSSAGYAVSGSDDGDQFLTDDLPLQTGCLLLDLQLQRVHGMDVLESLAKRKEGPQVIVITGHADVAVAVRSMKLGARDLLQKPFPKKRLLDAVKASFQTPVNKFSSDRMLAAQSRIAALSKREREVLHGLVAGMSNKLLAYEMNRSIRTIEMHRARMMDRLGVKTLADVLQIAFDAQFTREPTRPVRDEKRQSF